MKHLFLIASLLSLCFGLPNAFGALPADTDWEVRTTGDNDNGACVDASVVAGTTDYSLFDAAELTLTDGATAGAANTTFTTATGGFTAEMVGNCLYLKSGTNDVPGYYIITVYTDTNTVTLDRAPDDGVGGVSGGNFKVGGAAADPEFITPSVEDGHKVYIKSGTYAVTLDVDNAGDYKSNSKIWWIGYKDSRDDFPTGDDRPLLDSADTRANGIVADQSYNVFMNLRTQDATGAGILDSTICYYVNVKSHSNTGAGWDGRIYGIYGGEASNNGGKGIDSSGYNENFKIVNVYVHDNTSGGARGYTGSEALNSVADHNGGFAGFYYLDTAVGNVSYDNSGDGFNLAGIFFGMWINNIAKDNTGQGYDSVTPDYYYFRDFCIAHGNSAPDEYPTWRKFGENNLTSDPSFTNAAAGDFTLQAGSPALDAGMQMSDQGATGDYKVNIGVDQDDNTAAGGGDSAVGYWSSG